MGESKPVGITLYIISELIFGRSPDNPTLFFSNCLTNDKIISKYLNDNN